MTTKTQFTNIAIVIGVLMLLVLPVCADDPTVSSATPGVWLNNTALVVVIAGTNFPSQENTSVWLNQTGQTNLTATNFDRVSATQINVNFAKQLVHFGLWNVTVNNTSVTSEPYSMGTGLDKIEVTNAAPTLSLLSISSGLNNTFYPFTLTGTGFWPTSVVNLTTVSSTTPNRNITATNLVVNEYGTSIEGIFDLSVAGTQAGQYNVSLTNPDTQTVKGLEFTVFCPPPVITGVAPLSGTTDTSVKTIVVTGSQFNTSVPGSTVALVNGSTSLPVSSFTVGTGSITFNVNLESQPVGSYNITVNNNGPLYNNTTWTQPFQVFYPYPPVITGINQTTHVNTTNVSVLITGDKFQPGALVWLNRTGSSDILSSSIVYKEVSNITCNLTTKGTLAGQWYVKVVNNDNQSNILDASSLFTITAPPAPTANFTANITSGPAPLTVNFTDNSITTGSTTYQWVFSDGTTVGTQNSIHTFASPGVYNVFHSATNSSGTNWKNMTGYISATHQAKIAVYLNGGWWQDYNGNHVWNDPPVDRYYTFGSPYPTVPVVGAWNNTTPEVGVFQNGGWWLDNNGNFIWDGTGIGKDKQYTFGSPGCQPVVGDWNRNGVDKIGVFLNGGWWLDNNGNGQWDGTGTGSDVYYYFGSPGVTSVVGDWNRDGFREIGVFQNGGWWVDYNNNGQWDGTGAGQDKIYNFGSSGVNPVVGDWNEDGYDEIGIFLNGAWMVDYNANNVWDTGDQVYVFGSTGVTPAVIPI